MSQFQVSSIFTFILFSLLSCSSMPSDKAEIVKYNQFVESNISWGVDETTPLKQHFGKETQSASESVKPHLAKFYWQERRRSIPQSDSIVFPSENYDRPFADRYNKHRPNIPTPQRPLPFNFAYGLPSPPARTSSSFQENSLSPQQTQLLFQTVMKLFGGIMFTPQTQNQPQRTYRKFQERTSSLEAVVSPAVEAVEELDGVKYQSLYSGPRVPKSPCESGQHRTHGGSCHGKSRRLLNSYG